MTARYAATLALVAVGLIACGRERPSHYAIAGITAAAARRADRAPRWPSEPNDFAAWSDQSWDAIAPPPPEGRIARLLARARGVPPPDGTSWRYLRRSSSRDDDIVADTTAPFSASSVLRIIFTTDMLKDHEPGVHFIGLPRPKEVYSGWWMKVSPNWVCAPGCGKITMLFGDDTNGPGVTYSNLADGRNGTNYVNVATTWPQTGYKFWEPNVTKTTIPRGEWFQVEWYIKWASGPGNEDGVVKWWVNGVLNGHYPNVAFPNTPGFIEYQYAPTLMYVPSVEQYMYIDHTYISTPPRP